MDNSYYINNNSFNTINNLINKREFSLAENLLNSHLDKNADYHYLYSILLMGRHRPYSDDYYNNCYRRHNRGCACCCCDDCCCDCGHFSCCDLICLDQCCECMGGDLIECI